MSCYGGVSVHPQSQDSSIDAVDHTSHARAEKFKVSISICLSICSKRTVWDRNWICGRSELRTHLSCHLEYSDRRKAIEYREECSGGEMSCILIVF